MLMSCCDDKLTFVFQFGCRLGFEPSWVPEVFFRSRTRSPGQQRARIIFVPRYSRWQGSCTRALLSCEFWGYFTDALFFNRPGRECGSGKPKLKLKKVHSQGTNSTATSAGQVQIRHLNRTIFTDLLLFAELVFSNTNHSCSIIQ